MNPTSLSLVLIGIGPMCDPEGGTHDDIFRKPRVFDAQQERRQPIPTLHHALEDENHAIRVLQALLAGQQPRQEDMEPLKGEVRACLDAMQDALNEEGLPAVQKVFRALIVDRPWLARLASRQSPDAALPEQAEKPARRVRFLKDSEFEKRPPREWLIEGMVPKEGTVLLYGVSGSGKSFLTIDWSLSIATGTDWMGRKVRQGQVAYIAAEGGFGLGARTLAWKAHHGFTGESGVQWFEETLALQDAGNFAELLIAFLEDFETVPVLVILDTLSRCSGGAEENSNTEMAKITAAADALQQRFHCTVLIVHHAGKDSERGPRGASALVGNTETIIAVDRTDLGCRVSCFKQKDAAKFEAFSLKFQNVQYGPDQAEASVVLVRDDANPQPALRQSEAVMLAALTNAEEPLTYTEWVQAGVAAGLKERTAEGAIRSLQRGHYAVKLGKKQYALADSAEQEKEGREMVDPSFFDFDQASD